MSYRILTKNAVENTNIDGARDNNFNSGRRSGIVKGALNEGNFFSVSSNTIALDTCELRLCGHRIVLDSIEYKTLINIPKTASRYSLIAQVIVDDNKDVSFALIIQSALISLVQDNLDVSGKGKFELEIGRFTQQVDGSITDIVRTADLITGGSSGKASEWTVGEVTTNTIDAGMPANVDINYNEDTNAYDFQFDIPKGVDGQGQTNVKVAGVVQTEVNFESDPQSQINDVAADINNLETEINNINFNINTKANLDASNLSSENVTSWANKLGIDAVTTELNGKANIDASNLSGENVTSWANKFFPVGSIYMSVDSTSPASFLGGTWEQILGKFLLSSDDVLTDGIITTAGSYHIGDNGGSADAVVVSHTHTLRSLTDNGFTRWGTNVGGSATYVGPVGGTTTYVSGGQTMWNDNTGVDGTGKNMPPYLVVYMWKRTA